MGNLCCAVWSAWESWQGGYNKCLFHFNMFSSFAFKGHSWRAAIYFILFNLNIGLGNHMSLVVPMMKSTTMGMFPERTCCTWCVSSLWDHHPLWWASGLNCELHPKVSRRGLSRSSIQCTTEIQIGYNTQSQFMGLGFSSLKMQQSSLLPVTCISTM